MPTCPGCAERIPYRRLPVHERYCPGIWTEGSDPDHQSRALEQLHVDTERRDRRLAARVDRLERSVAELEAARELPKEP